MHLVRIDLQQGFPQMLLKIFELSTLMGDNKSISTTNFLVVRVVCVYHCRRPLSTHQAGNLSFDFLRLPEIFQTVRGGNDVPARSFHFATLAR